MVPGGQYIIPYKSRASVFDLIPLGDIHIGNRACAKDKLRADIERIRANPNARWIGIGDYCEFIGYQDKRFDADAIAENISVRDLSELGFILMREIRDLFMPIKDKCIGLLQGNHERSYEQKFQQRLTEWLACEMQTKCFDYSTILDIVFRRTFKRGAPSAQAFRVYAHHGSGYAQTPGGKLNRLIKFMDTWPKADIVVMGHVHEKKIHYKVPLDGDHKCHRIIQFQQVGVITGSYLKTCAEGVTTYAEQRGYAPVALGAAFIRIKPETREIEVQ